MAAAVTAAMLCGCSREAMGPGQPDPDAPGVADGWIAVELADADAPGSRSTNKEYGDRYEYFEWFNKGTLNERAVTEDSECNRVLFFGNDEAFLGSGKLQKPSVKTTSSNIYVAKKPETVVETPAYALVVLNADPARMDALETKLAADGTAAVKTVLTYINEVDPENPESLAMSGEYFTMTSCVWRAEDADHITVLNALDQDGPVFYETEEEAILPENLTRFYVERILAKFTLIIKDAEEGNMRFNEYTSRIIVPGVNPKKVRTEYSQSGEDSKDVMTGWHVNLVNWGLNGLEKNTYLLKSLTSTPGTVYPTDWKVDGNFYVGWNSTDLFRSYWALDEHYTDGIYPDQYRQALDAEGVTAATTNTIYSDDFNAEDGLAKSDYTLIYKPFNAYEDLTENKYALENTFDPAVLAGQDLSTQPWLRCGTHIILTAQLIFDEFDKVDLTGDKPGFIEGISDKYFSNGLWWSEKALKEQAVATLMTNIYYNKKGDIYKIPNVVKGTGYVDFINTEEHELDDQVPVAIKVGGEIKPLTHDMLETIAEDYFEFVPAFIKGGDGWVMLNKKADVDLYAYYYRYNDAGEKENYVLDEPISDEQLVSYIYNFTNRARHFAEGRMYYALPIRHNLESLSFESNPVTRVRVGDYGVVRNTWYRLTITSIENTGTPVDDPDQPIIPNPEPDDKSLGVEVEIIPWRTVEINVDQLH